MRAFLPLAIAVTLQAVAAVQAGSATAPELADPEGDVEAYAGLPLDPNPAFDLRAAYVAGETESKFEVAIVVADLSAVMQTDAGAVTITTFAFFFELDHYAPIGRAAREGPWTARADYLPNNDRPMQFSLEAPCPSPEGSCTAADRDIVADLNGSFDFASSTVWIEVPRIFLESPRAGDRLANLAAVVKAMWPAYPVSWTDWDQDQPEAAYQFTLPVAAPGAAPLTNLTTARQPSTGDTSEPPLDRTREKETPAVALGVTVACLIALGSGLRRRP